MMKFKTPRWFLAYIAAAAAACSPVAAQTNLRLGPACTAVSIANGVTVDQNTITFQMNGMGLQGSGCSSTPIPNQPAITGGPSTWNLPVAPQSAPYAISRTWSALNSTSCTYSGSNAAAGALPGWGTGFACNSTASCSATHPVTFNLNPSTSTAYSFGLLCSNATASVTDGPAVVTVQPVVTPPPTGCIANPGWSRQTTGSVVYNASYTAYPPDGLMTWESIWGRPYPAMTPVTEWPSLALSEVVGPMVVYKKYISAQFTVRAESVPKAGQLSITQTNFQKPISMTISTRCGDFDQASHNIPAGCARPMLRGEGFLAWEVAGTSSSCRLTVGQTYYLNLIYADLANSANGKPLGSSTCQGQCSNNIKNQR